MQVDKTEKFERTNVFQRRLLQLVHLKLVRTIRASTYQVMIKKSYCLFLAFNPIMIEYTEPYSVCTSCEVISRLPHWNSAR